MNLLDQEQQYFNITTEKKKNTDMQHVASNVSKLMNFIAQVNFEAKSI